MLDLHLLPAYDSMTQDFPLPAALPCRLAPLSGGREYEHAVVYSDLDFNCHANSVKYIQWAVDTLPLELLQQKRFARTDINFIREARYGERLRIVAAEEALAFEIRNPEREAVCRIAFRME